MGNDAIVRFHAESSELDNKLKKAVEQFQRVEKEVRRTGGTFAYADKEELAFIKSLGSMETKANSAKGKIAEMTNAFTELSLQYNRLSKEEKNSPFGKAMADSIGQIKGRIGDLGGQLNDVGAELKTTGGFIDTLADGLGQLGPVGQTAGKLLKGAFGPVGIAIAAVVGVIKQVVEAFKRNEDAMAGATRAAAPFKAIWQQIQRLFDRLVPHIVDGMEKISSGMQSMFSKITDWMGKLSNTALGKKLGLDKVYEQLKKVSSAQAELTESNKKIADSENALKSMRRSTETGNTQRRAQISELRFKASDKTNYSAEERVGFLEKALELEGKTLRANIALREKEYELIKLKNSLTNSGTEDLDAENDALNAITDARTEYNNHIRETQSQLESARKEMEKEVKVAEKTAASEPQASNPAMSGPSMSAFEKLQQSIRIKLADQNFEVDQTSLTNIMTVAIKHGIDGMDGAFEGIQYQLAEGMNIPDSAWEELADQINTKLAELGLDPIKLNVETGGVETLSKEVEQTTDHVAGAAAAFSALGNAMSNIDDPGAQVAGLIAQAIGSVAAGYGAATAQAATMGPWAWITFAITGLATMISTIAGIKSATAGSYASGGIVPGTSYSGDNTIIAANAGEVVLNRAQQTNLAGQLEAGSLPNNLHLSTEISGTNLRVVLDNDNRSKGGSRGAYSRIK